MVDMEFPFSAAAAARVQKRVESGFHFASQKIADTYGSMGIGWDLTLCTLSIKTVVRCYARYLSTYERSVASDKRDLLAVCGRNFR